MPSFNRVIIEGNITRDPELRFTPNGKAVCRVGLAINRTWKDEAGNKHDDVTFVDCDLWGKTAELAAKHLAKGRAVLFEGRLKLDTWDDKKTGEKRSKLGVLVESMVFQGDANKREEAPERPDASDIPKTKPAATSEPETDDVPF